MLPSYVHRRKVRHGWIDTRPGGGTAGAVRGWLRCLPDRAGAFAPLGAGACAPGQAYELLDDGRGPRGRAAHADDGGAVPRGTAAAGTGGDDLAARQPTAARLFGGAW